jgi:hypothetical protein
LRSNDQSKLATNENNTAMPQAMKLATRGVSRKCRQI